MADFPFAFSPRREIEADFPRLLRLISRRLTRLRLRPGSDPLHEIRTLIKLLRALLWLAQPNLPPAAAATAKKQFQTAAQSLSGARDATVLQSTLAALKKDAKDPAAMRRLEEKLAARNGHFSIQQLHKAESHIKKIITQLERDAATKQKWKSPTKRLKKSLHQAARARKTARKEKSDPAFHEWRKKAKRLLYLLQVLEPHLPKKQRRLISRIDQIQHQLGDAQDSVVLQATLKKKIPASDPALKPALRQLDKRKRKLRKKAARLSRQVHL